MALLDRGPSPGPERSGDLPGTGTRPDASSRSDPGASRGRVQAAVWLNGAMVVVIIVLLIAAVVLGGLWLFRRQGSDELHSVDGYRQALHTLQEVRSRSSSVRVIGASSTRSASDEEAHDPLGPEGDDRQTLRIGGPPAAGGPRRLVFEDDRRDLGTRQERQHHRGGRQRHRRDSAMSAMNRPPRRLGGPALAAVIVIVVVVVLAIAGSHLHSSSKSTARQTAGTTASAPSRRQGTHHASGAGSSPSSTTTTLPSTISPVSSTASGAVYDLPSSSYSLSFTATNGNCWVQVTEES